MKSIKAFFSGISAEMRKCTWPERRELLESTVVVIISVILLALFVGASDLVLINMLKLLIPTG